MASTYLSLTNRVITRVNQIELTAADFTVPDSFQANAKQAVNNAIRAINQMSYEWPFNHRSTTQLLTERQSTYSFPSDYKAIDWDSFYIEPEESLHVGAASVRQIEFNEWKNRYRQRDLDLNNRGNVPDYVYQRNDEKFGLSNIPDQAYTLNYEYWSAPADLVAATDTTNIPSRFDYAIEEGAMYYVFLFKNDEEKARVADIKFRELVKDMRTILGVNEYNQAFDTRIKVRGPGSFLK